MVHKVMSEVTMAEVEARSVFHMIIETSLSFLEASLSHKRHSTTFPPQNQPKWLPSTTSSPNPQQK
jgi:hypothetical protein